MSEVMIPPWVKPESPETIRWIDDATAAFPPAFGRGTTQRGIWADPRWGLRRRYRGLRSDEKSAILNALNETRGQFNILRVTTHASVRGSMPTTALLTDGMFASGTTYWGGSGLTATVSDRVIRFTRSASGSVAGGQLASISVSQYTPYVARAFFESSTTQDQVLSVGLGSAQYSDALARSTFVINGLASVAYVPTVSSLYFTIADNASTGRGALDFFEMPYASLSQCALVDLGTNFLLQSDALGNGAIWSGVTGLSSITDNAVADPFGSTTGETIIENSSNSQHFVGQGVSGITSTTGVDFAFACALKAGTRSFAELTMIETSGTTACVAFFNLGTGAVGTTSAGANWSNVRAFITALGNGWYYCCVVGKKTNAATGITCRIQIASANGTDSYLGNGTGSISAWRATLAQSSVPMRLAQTTSSASSGTAPTGSTMYSKGWPVSTNGLLLSGDWFELNGQLKQLTAPVNSDAAGLARIQFRPGVAGSPLDGDPIVVSEPLGRFIYPQATRELENLFGIYGDCEMNLEEVYV